MNPLTPLVPKVVKKQWQAPAIVLEYSLVARAQGPVLGEDAFAPVEEDPFLGAFTVSCIGCG